MFGQKMIEDKGYCIPKIFLLYSRRMCEGQLNLYKNALLRTFTQQYAEHYIPWLEQRIKYFKAKELING